MSLSRKDHYLRAAVALGFLGAFTLAAMVVESTKSVVPRVEHGSGPAAGAAARRDALERRFQLQGSSPRGEYDDAPRFGSFPGTLPATGSPLR